MKYFVFAASLVLLAGGAAIAQQLPPLSSPRADIVALVREDQKIWVLSASPSSESPTMDLYDPDAGVVDVLPGPRTGVMPNATVLLRDGRILACGMTCSVFEPARRDWVEVKSFGSFGWLAAMTPLSDGTVMITGGWDESKALSRVHIIDPVRMTARPAGNLRHARYGHAAVTLRDGRVLVVGRWVGEATQVRDEIYDPRSGEWTALDDGIGVQAAALTVTLPDGRVVAADLTHGGVFDPMTNRWTSARGLRSRERAQMALLPNNKVLISGGAEWIGNFQVVSSNQCFAVAEDRIDWLPGEARAGHGVAVLRNGRVLRLGGYRWLRGPDASVEEIRWRYPHFGIGIQPGLHIATATLDPKRSRDGSWGISASVFRDKFRPRFQFGRAMHFGGTLGRSGMEPGFSAFRIESRQVVSIHVALRPVPGYPVAPDVSLQILDSQRRPVGAGVRGSGVLNLTRALEAGSYILELRSGESAPAAIFDVTVSAPDMVEALYAGGSLQAQAGVPGYLAFWATEAAYISISGYDETDYGTHAGVRGLLVTLLDSAGRVLARAGD